jgi:hypothetical protein
MIGWAVPGAMHGAPFPGFLKRFTKAFGLVGACLGATASVAGFVPGLSADKASATCYWVRGAAYNWPACNYGGIAAYDQKVSTYQYSGLNRFWTANAPTYKQTLFAGTGFTYNSGIVYTQWLDFSYPSAWGTGYCVNQNSGGVDGTCGLQ